MTPDTLTRKVGRANQTMEPLEAPPHAIWRDDFEEFGPDRWPAGGRTRLGPARALP